MTDKKPKFLAFCKDGSEQVVIKEFLKAQGLEDNLVLQGDIGTASEYLKSNPSPLLLLVEIPSAQAAPALLDALANVCDPDTKVIIIGDVNEYSFYCWLTDIGIFSYLLRPLTKEKLEKAYQKSQNLPVNLVGDVKEPTKIMAVIGARGGVGASTVALNLAGIFAEHGGGKKVALVDLDPQEGTLSLMLDIEPARGLRDALEKPDRIDPLFIDRVMNKAHENLWVLSAEEQLKDIIHIGELTADALMRELCNKYDIVVLDVPRHIGQFGRELLKKAGNIIMVAELTLQSLRDTLRVSDLIVENLKLSPPSVIINRAGMAPKNEISLADFEKGITAKIVEKIVFTPDVFMSIGIDIPSITHAKHASMKPLYTYAKELVPSINFEDAAKDKKGFGLFKKK